MKISYKFTQDVSIEKGHLSICFIFNDIKNFYSIIRLFSREIYDRKPSLRLFFINLFKIVSLFIQ